MKNIILKSAFLGVVLSGSAIKAQHLLEALDAPAIFTSTKTAEYTASFTKSSCTADNFTNFPKPVSYTQSVTVTATSTESQAEADRLAMEKATQEAKDKVNAGGQAYAEANGGCLDYRNIKGKCMVSYISSRGDYIVREEDLIHPEFAMCYGSAFQDAQAYTNANFDFTGKEHGNKVKVEARFYPNDKTLPSYGWFVYQTMSGWDLTDDHYLIEKGTFEPQQ